jgi:HAD superfamily phosphoserine phosphatase-like hydrolase
MSSVPKIAVYDLDRTITVRGTYTPFLLRAAMRRAPWRLLLVPAVLAAMILYVLKLIDRRILKSWMIFLMLGRISRTDMQRLADGFYAHLIRAGDIRPGALRQIAQDRADGRRLVMATASFDFYATSLGQAMGFDLVVATRSKWDAQDRLVAAVDGANCYGADKLSFLKAALGPDPVDAVFYSDHHSDAPCFIWAGKGLAVNPTAKLKKAAASLGATSVDWGVAHVSHSPR